MRVVVALVRLTEELPDERRTVSGRNYSLLLRGIETIRDTVANRVASSFGVPLDDRLRNAIADVREILKPLPDEAPSPATTELSFIPDAALRDSIRNDISAAYRALHDGLWKASTVLAGAATEALLLWAITERKSELEVEGARKARIPKAGKDPNGWPQPLRPGRRSGRSHQNRDSDASHSRTQVSEFHSPRPLCSACSGLR